MRCWRWASPEAASLCAKAGVADAVAAIGRLTAELIDEVGFDRPPFSPEILASFRGVREVRRVAMTSAGRLLTEGGALVIEVNRDHSLGKQNFSADHEVTHTLFPSYGRQRIDDAETGTFASGHEEELLCDIGAAALLLDPRHLRPLAEEAGPSITTLVGLAALFKASLQATARQLALLDLWPCAFVFWEEGYRKDERIADNQLPMPILGELGRPQPKLRVRTPYVAASFGSFVPENKSVDDSSLVAACCEAEPLTFGVADFELGGHRLVSLYCENYHAPYRCSEEVRRRVISLLLPSRLKNRRAATPGAYQLESL